ncbi:MAG: ATP-grasp domain-containing protein [Clostridiales bacterium]|jgi:acetyl-CoA carboxylase biotin carboxylase subunit|nr:ATP-grasp domain-containing protein [Clostridiales bacterium]
MYTKMFVANRGEIAVRVINECKKLGIKTVAACSDTERNALHMRIADKGYCIGAAAVKDSYMNAQAIINAALITESDVIHPGYGFLSENTEFARTCERQGVSFVGPASDTLAQAADKINTKRIAVSQQIPVLKGYLVEDVEDALSRADEIGYPVMLKVSSGGGGAGMESVFNDNELKKTFESLQPLKCGGILLEKFIEIARHIEVQIMADKYGNMLTIGNRECSIQIRNKKVLEECPAQNLSDVLLNRMYADSVKLARALNYVGVGTIEFLVDDTENYYFMEMNARIQVEHGITEMITGINLVEWQIKISAGEKIPFAQDKIKFSGHALECRINAQTCGRIADWRLNNSEVRFDHALTSGLTIWPYYDSLLGKLISHGQTRKDAVDKMCGYLNDLHISGIKTNMDMHKRILHNDCFLSGVYYTNILENEGYVNRQT